MSAEELKFILERISANGTGLIFWLILWNSD